MIRETRSAGSAIRATRAIPATTMPSLL